MKLFKRKIELPGYWTTYEALFKEKSSNDVSKVRFVVLDTETTGFDYGEDRILSIGALSLLNNSILVNDIFDVYLSQEKHTKESIKVHGILKEGSKARISEVEALEQFLGYLGNAIIVAHHAMFDIQMINKALGRNGLPKLKNRYLDTSTLYKKTRIRSNLLQQQEIYTLDELADKFDITKKDRHTALGDAYITAIVFLRILNRLKEKREITLKWLL
ncbi:MAG: 3'-5' exonuclease [Flavobacteriaceae bacterium]